uniref:Uncharacterized protein n=1 Tax=Anopheles atroparvus TaxID=41427 RepID=A0A182J690_ANOAO
MTFGNTLNARDTKPRRTDAIGRPAAVQSSDSRLEGTCSIPYSQEEVKNELRASTKWPRGHYFGRGGEVATFDRASAVAKPDRQAKPSQSPNRHAPRRNRPFVVAVVVFVVAAVAAAVIAVQSQMHRVTAMGVYVRHYASFLVPKQHQQKCSWQW